MGLLSGNRPRRNSTDSRASSSKGFASKMFANLTPNAVFRKGKNSAKANVSVDNELETHLCQLAMMENYANHDMYIKFTQEEASALEEKVLQFALAESRADAKAKSSGVSRKANSKASSIGAFPYTAEEAQQILRALRAEDDPTFVEVAASLDPVTHAATNSDPVTDNATPSSPVTTAATSGELVTHAATNSERPPPMQPSDYRDLNGNAVPPPPKSKSFSSWKRKFGLGKSKESSEPARKKDALGRSTSNQEDLKQNYGIGSYDHFAGEADGLGMEYSNGYIFPRDAESPTTSQAANNEGPSRSPPEQEGNPAEKVALHLAMKESEVQIGYDNVLRNARQLQRDLLHETRRCQKMEVQEAKRRDKLDDRMQKLTSAQKRVPVKLTSELAEAQHQANDARVRMEVLADAVTELDTFLEYIDSKRPSIEDAEKLSESIIRQVLQKLNLAGFKFDIPQEKDVPQEPDVGATTGMAAAEKRPKTAANPSTGPRPSVGQEPGLPMLVSPFQEEKQRSANHRETEFGITEVKDKQLEQKSLILQTSNDITPSTPLQKVASRPSSSPAPSESSFQWSQQSARTTFADLAQGGGGSTFTTPSPGGKPPTSRSKKLSGSLSNPKVFERPSSRAPEALSISQQRPFNASPRRSGSVDTRSIASLDSRPSSQTRWSISGPFHVKRSAQVVHLYNEMRKWLPEVMEVTNSPLERTASGSNALLTKDKLHAHNQSEGVAGSIHAISVEELKVALNDTPVLDVDTICELADRIATGNEHHEMPAVLSTDPDFPLARWRAAQAARKFYLDLQEMEASLASWQSSHGSFKEESLEFEVTLDSDRVRLDALLAQISKADHRWTLHKINWDGSIVKQCRYAPLNAASQIMSNALAEVATLERSQTLQARECTGVLAIAVRIAYKAHQFAGGFNQDCTELFEKVKRLAQYYLRSQDPQWLKDTNLANYR